MTTRRTLASPLLALTCALAVAAAPLAASDPPPPPGGFTPARLADVPVTWSDGYRSFMDCYYPDATAGPNGWPIVLALHGGQGTRKNWKIRERGWYLARRGYVVIAYDMRDNTVTGPLNPGATFDEWDEMRDVAEAFHDAPTLFPTVPMDTRRLGMTGISAGARKTYRAAGLAGQMLLRPGQVVTHMPTLRAAVPTATHLDPLEDTLPGGGLTMRTDFAVGVPPRLPAGHPITAGIQAYDTAALTTELRLRPLYDFLPLVQSTAVPLLIVNAWDDAEHHVRSIVDTLPTLDPSAGHRVLFGTDGVHSVPANTVEIEYLYESTARWFDRHLKGRPNRVGVEPKFELSFPPVEQSRYLDPSSTWGHRLSVNFPETPVSSAQSLYLGPGARLRSTPLPAPAAPATVQHRIGAGYDLAAFLADQGAPGSVLQPAKIPLDRETFDTTPLASDLELLGRTRLTLDVDTNVADWQLHAALWAVPAAGVGTPRQLTTAFVAKRGAAIGRHTLTFEFNDIAYRVPAGTTLRLTLENVSLVDKPLSRRIHVVPFFVDADFDIALDPAAPARLDLPVPPQVDAWLTPRLGTASATAAGGIDHPLLVEAGASRAGQPYVVLASGSGWAPGTTVPPSVLPLNLDAWTSLSSALANTGPFVDTVGFLDADGTATARFAPSTHPIVSSLVGLELTFACGGFDSRGFWTGGPAVLRIDP